MPSQSGYWDAVGRKKTFAHPLLFNELEKYVNRRSSILDYGCGYGRTLRKLHERGFSNLSGIDYSSKMIERAKAENPFAQYEKNSGWEVPFPSETFDAVLLLAVLTGNPRSEDQARLFQELKRTLKPGGILYLSDCLINHDDRRNRERYKRFQPKYRCYGVFDLADGGTMRHHSLAYLEGLARDFQALLEEKFRVKTMNGHNARGIRMILQKRAPAGAAL